MGEAKRRRDTGLPRVHAAPSSEPIMITDPLLIVFRGPDRTVQTRIHSSDMDHRAYGLLIADLVRHVARAFKVDDEDVWEWVEKERDHPTTDIRNPS